MNKLIAIGRLTADPTIREVNGASVCNFTLAVNTRKKDEEGNPIANFYRVDAWRGLAETCAKYLHKGDRASVIGELFLRAYTDTKGQTRFSLDVTADEVEFLQERGSAPSSSPAPTTKKPSKASIANNAAVQDDDDEDEDLPF